MRGLTFAAVLLASAVVAAEPAALQEQVGPPGLKWGMHPAEVKAALRSHFGTPHVSKVEGSPSTVLSFSSGPFEGLPAERVEAEFACDELRRFTVTFTGSEARPLYRLWQDVTAKMTAQHGQPAELEEPPAVEAAKQAGSSTTDRALPEAVTRDLREHRGRLSAMWRFARERLVTAVATVKPADRQGRRQQVVVWTFNDGGPETAQCLAQHFAE